VRWTVCGVFGLALSAHASWFVDLGQPARSGLLVAPLLPVFMEL